MSFVRSNESAMNVASPAANTSVINTVFNPWAALSMSGLSLDTISLFQFANRDEESALGGIGSGKYMSGDGPLFSGITLIA